MLGSFAANVNGKIPTSSSAIRVIPMVSDVCQYANDVGLYALTIILTIISALCVLYALYMMAKIKCSSPVLALGICLEGIAASSMRCVELVSYPTIATGVGYYYIFDSDMDVYVSYLPTLFGACSNLAMAGLWLRLAISRQFSKSQNMAYIAGVYVSVTAFFVVGMIFIS